MIRVERFAPEHVEEWNRFVGNGKNTVFLFQRGYMEYHADRYVDHSLMFRAGTRLIGVLPANESDGDLISHAGLTYGGVVVGYKTTTAQMLEIFEVMRAYMRDAGFSRLIYKVMPHIYHRIPAEEDLYALFRMGAKLTRRDVSSTIRLSERVPLAKGRKSSLNIAKRNAINVARENCFHEFMELEAAQLSKRYNVRPVHTADEISLLAGRFPDNIKLFTARERGALLSGMIVYETDNVAHAQYIAVSDRGREICSHDRLIDVLLREVYVSKRYFDFGISTESNGTSLNEGLIANKEGFGARATVHDFYELDVCC